MKVIQQARTALLFCERADELFDQDKLEQSLATFTKAIDIDNTCAAAWAGRGSAQNALQRWEAAVSDTTRAIDLNEDDVTSLYNVSDSGALYQVNRFFTLLLSPCSLSA
jgi:tetratricopeptide (TPR) repeat protein